MDGRVASHPFQGGRRPRVYAAAAPTESHHDGHTWQLAYCRGAPAKTGEAVPLAPTPHRPRRPPASPRRPHAHSLIRSPPPLLHTVPFCGAPPPLPPPRFPSVAFELFSCFFFLVCLSSLSVSPWPPPAADPTYPPPPPSPRPPPCRGGGGRNGDARPWDRAGCGFHGRSQPHSVRAGSGLGGDAGGGRDRRGKGERPQARRQTD